MRSFDYLRIVTAAYAGEQQTEVGLTADPKRWASRGDRADLFLLRRRALFDL